MEITLLIMENHGIVFLNFCGNPDYDSLECLCRSQVKLVIQVWP